MVGLIGSSNNPVSGMAIATLLIATMAIKGSGKTGIDGMTAAIAIGSVICIIAAIAGDTSQDLKTGYLLGATPKKQQWVDARCCCFRSCYRSVFCIFWMQHGATVQQRSLLRRLSL